MPNIQGGNFTDSNVWWWYQKIIFALKELNQENPELAEELATSFAGYVDEVTKDTDWCIYACLRELEAIEPDQREFERRWHNKNEARKIRGVEAFLHYRQDLTGTLDSLEKNFGSKSKMDKILKIREDEWKMVLGDDPYDSVDWGNPLTWPDTFSDSLPD